MLKHYQREQIIWESNLTGNEKLLLLSLNSFVDANGECWPGQELLARMCSFTDRTIRNLCKQLEAKSIIQRHRRFNNQGFRTSDRFSILFDSIADKKQSLPETVSGRRVVKVSDTVLPETVSTGKSFHRKITTVLPENHDSPTGKSRQTLPETVSGDLSSKNYLEELSNDQDPPIVPQGDSSSQTVLRGEPSQQPEQPVISDQQSEEPKGSDSQQKSKSSGKRKKSKKRELPEVTVHQKQQARHIYNERKPNLWAVAENIGEERETMLRKALKVADGDWDLVIDRMIRGLSMARLDPWWSGTKDGDCYQGGCFESTFRNSMYIKWAEMLSTKGLNPDKMLDSGMTDLELQEAHIQYQKRQQKGSTPQASAYERYKAEKAANEAKRRELEAC